MILCWQFWSAYVSQFKVMSSSQVNAHFNWGIIYYKGGPINMWKMIPTRKYYFTMRQIQLSFSQFNCPSIQLYFFFISNEKLGSKIKDHRKVDIIFQNQAYRTTCKVCGFSRLKIALFTSVLITGRNQLTMKKCMQAKNVC